MRFPHFLYCRGSLPLLTLLIVISVLSSTTSEAAVEEWQSGALLLYSKSAVEMNRLRAQGLNDKRLLAYIDAVERMHNELGDKREIAESRVILRTLAEGSLDDDVGVASAYYDIRITQLLQESPDPLKAARDFRALYVERPRHFFGQLALLKSVLIDLDSLGSGSGVLPLLASLEGKEVQLTISDLRRSYHKALGEAFGRSTTLQRKSFDHLKAAYEIGFTVKLIQADLCFDLGQLAEHLGDEDYAIGLYEEFVDKYSDDSRAQELAAHIRILKK